VTVTLYRAVSAPIPAPNSGKISGPISNGLTSYSNVRTCRMTDRQLSNDDDPKGRINCF